MINKMSSVLIAIGMIFVLSHSVHAAPPIDVIPCITANWVLCGVNLGTAVFGLHQWSDDASYKV
jgi:hypothetical protein